MAVALVPVGLTGPAGATIVAPTYTDAEIRAGYRSVELALTCADPRTSPVGALTWSDTVAAGDAATSAEASESYTLSTNAGELRAIDVRQSTVGRAQRPQVGQLAFGDATFTMEFEVTGASHAFSLNATVVNNTNDEMGGQAGDCEIFLAQADGDEQVLVNFDCTDLENGTHPIALSGVLEPNVYELSIESNAASFGWAPHTADNSVQFHMEIAAGTSFDSDGDGLTDDDEADLHNTDPQNADTDNDFARDGEEVLLLGTNPLDADSDDDDRLDGEEAFGIIGSDPLDPDSDNDGLSDGEEIVEGTAPTNPDTDSDGFGDGQEVFQLASDPLDPNDPGPGADPTALVEDALDQLDDTPDSSLRAPGHRGALEVRMEAVRTSIVAGDLEGAVAKLVALRQRVDGCGTAPENNDWVTDCAAQIELRAIVDALIDLLTT